MLWPRRLRRGHLRMAAQQGPWMGTGVRHRGSNSSAFRPRLPGDLKHGSHAVVIYHGRTCTGCKTGGSGACILKPTVSASGSDGLGKVRLCYAQCYIFAYARVPAGMSPAQLINVNCDEILEPPLGANTRAERLCLASLEVRVQTTRCLVHFLCPRCTVPNFSSCCGIQPSQFYSLAMGDCVVQ
jgi:hypothetical protein